MTSDMKSDPYLVADEAAVSWAAIFAGATAALSVSLVLTVLAAGFGYAFAPGAIASKGSLAGFTPAVGAGAVAVQVLSAALGGYLAGRLRPAWGASHGDEAHFRDTAHGFLAWAVSAVAGVLLAATVLTPYAEQMAGAVATAPASAQRTADVAAQSAFFIGVGLLLSAFTAAVAGRLGGLRSDDMRVRHRG